jgi:DNA-binding NtrC family response regulator/iron only hydrogenase large subunit-like protein
LHISDGSFTITPETEDVVKPIITITEKCRKCYSCVRSCPVKAIRVEKNHSEIIYERCIGCGNCLAGCPQKAKVVSGKAAQTEKMLASGEPVVAVLGCSYPAYFHNVRPGQLAAALKKIGFSEVHEGAFGAELVAGSYARAIEEATEPLISSHCPAVVDLIERHYPKLIDNLVPIVSPMIAIGRFLKADADRETKVVYLSSCVAARFDVTSEEAKGAVDAVLTYRELEEIFRSRGINLDRLEDEPLSGVQPHLGHLFPISEGTFKAFSIATHPLDTEIITAEGEVNVMGIIRDLASGRIQPRIADIRFCYGGCIGGPGTNAGLTEFYKRNLIIQHFKRDIPCETEPRYLTRSVPHLGRSFSNKFARLDIPKGSDVRKILALTNKFTQKDELNCRACGYRTCHEYAVAVHQGLADLEMCLPFNVQQLEEDRGKLIQKYELARRELEREYDEFMVGNDRKTLEVLDLIKQVGPTPTTVLIRGESGTGKELTARAIHRYSRRNDKPLVTVNCTTLTDTLLESELFGHRKGSFTGAVADKKGLFEAADGGTIFLDEIGDITPKLQAELLRVLDQGELRPVGGTAAKKVDVRLIAATNKNLEVGVREGWFREDLYYRLNVFAITMPPLRNRIESIPLLAHHFLEKSKQKLNKNIVGIEDRAITAMMRYPWPGNIREMRNVVERGAVLTHDALIKLENLPSVFRDQYGTDAGSAAEAAGNGLKDELQRQVGVLEKKFVSQFLTETGGNVVKAAALAGIPRRSFYRLMNRYGISGRELKRSLKSEV